MVRSLHHVTATVVAAQEDLDFFVGRLGLRLVKRTVNFDNAGVYHFYYGDEAGAPGTIFTTFPYGPLGVAPGVIGTGQVTVTALSAPPGSLDEWRARLGGSAQLIERPFGEQAVRFTDPSGLRFELVADSEDDRAGWEGSEVDPDLAVRGLHHVTLTVPDPEATARFAEDVLGMTVARSDRGVLRLACGADRPGARVDVRAPAGDPAARNGLGTVHHVAFAVAGSDEQLAIREDVERRGIQVTPVMDRKYFQSIYFREPGGVLYEVATMQPGFAVDEDPSRLGAALCLPDWQELERATIEAKLPPIRVP